MASAPAGSSFVQIYLDQAFSSESGATINDAVQSLFAGQAGAGDIAETITSQAQSG